MPRHLRAPAARRLQTGSFLLEAMFALAIMTSVTVLYVRMADHKAKATRAEIEGEALGQFAVGLRGFVANAQSDPALIPGGEMTGVNWLKSPACGGIASNPAEGYVPCNFTGQTFGSLYRSRFTYDATTNAIEARTDFIVPTVGDGPRNSILLADRVVETANSQQTLANNGMFYVAYANVPPTAMGVATGAAIADPGPDAGRVVMVVNNAPSQDIWLRTDGTNKMLANLNMGGNSLANAKDGRFTGQVQIDQGMTVTNGVAELRGGAITPDVALTSIGKAATQGIYDARVLTGANSYSVPKPDCTKAGNRPAIYVAMQGTGTINADGAYNADTLYESRADVVDTGGSWTISPIVRGTRFDFSPDGAGGMTIDRSVVQRNAHDMRLVVLLRCQ